MKNKRTTTTIAAALVGGIAIGSFASPPMAALAADTSSAEAKADTARTPGQWISESLKGLVDKGTITQEQSDAVAKTLEDAKPERGGHGGHRHGFGHIRVDLSTAAAPLNMSEEDLKTALQTKSLADIAKEKNVDVQKVIDALVADESTQLDEAVKNGRLTQERADKMKEKMKERVTNMVNKVHDERGKHKMGFPPDSALPVLPGAPAPDAPTAPSALSL
jgi:gas vesicle protein